jgi:SagB-type dehydrogenase family enzyme
LLHLTDLQLPLAGLVSSLIAEANVQTADRYRRSRGIVIFWAEAQAVCFVWQSAQRIPITSDAVGILHHLTDWTSVAELRDRIATGSDPSVVAETIDLLRTLGLVEREGDPRVGSEWSEWPAAAFFHFATKNGTFPTDLQQRERELGEKATHHPQPPPTKHIDGPRLRLPDIGVSSTDLQSTLTKRRTWRRFSREPVPTAALGTLLNATFGVQARGTVPGQGPVIVRTSPSGGSRHPVEAYVLAWNVDGLTPGAYHYDSDTMELVDLQRPIAANDIPALLAHQTYFAGAAAAVIMCPVFARTMWRYGHSRAYRTVLIDTGHLGQTFCLVATALGLAPFTTMAFSESGLEALLGLDGVSECPIYVAGVGMPDAAAGNSPGRWDVDR